MCRELKIPASLLLVIGTITPLFAQLPAGWTSAGVGNPAVAGSAQYDKATETWTIRGDGTGIRGTADQFHFVYKTLNGDGELAMRVVSLDPLLTDWSMAGVMIRVLLTPGSPSIFMGISANTDTKDHGITMWGRAAMNGAAGDESTGAMTAPYWVKVKRAGDTFTGYSSPNGKDWTERYTTSAPGIPKSIYIGYAVSSEVGGKLLTAVFDNGPMAATDPNPVDGAKDVVAPLLRWTPGATATAHEVYLGATPDLGPADYRGQLPAPTTIYFHTPGLTPGATYYWRIDEIGADGTTKYKGDTWSFTAAAATAYAPKPWNGLHGVPVEADLTWTGGAGAMSHDLYFGTDKAAVAAGDPSTFKGNLTMPLYDLGTLAEHSTYYWRVDEHDTAAVVHPGQVWSFTTIGPEIGVKAQYFKGIDLAGGPVLTRVEPSIDHSWGSAEVAAGLSDGVSARWTADLQAPFSETYQLTTTTDDGVRLWLDGRRIINNWTNHGNTDDIARVDLIAGQVYRLQMEWYDNTGTATARLSWQSPSIANQTIPAGPLQLPLRAVNSYPAHTAKDVPQTLEMHWWAGEKATRHDVYFGDNANAVANAGTTTTGIYRGRQTLDAATFDPGELEWNKAYYWRVDEVNTADNDSPWTGSVWSFTTANFLVIDDFESYTDNEGDRIYQTWIDGETNHTGSLVGYTEAPFAEQKVIHGGRQSMPMDYNNVKSPWYSEAEREWPAPQNWTVNGVNTLVLYIRGAAANTPAPLYVAVEDKAGHVAVIAHPDSALVTTLQWTEWRIPLANISSAGVNVAAVKKIYIGVGNRSKPTTGGAGRIYIDDLRVIKAGS
jgi:hypothetical protein